MTSRELKEQRAKLIANARVIVDSAEADQRDLTAEEQASVDAMFGEADQLAEEAASKERKEKLESAEAELRATAGRKTVPGKLARTIDVTAHDRQMALRAWCLQGTDKAMTSPDILHRAAQCGINLNSRNLNVRGLIKSTSDTPKAGYTVPLGFESAIEQKLKYYCPLRNICRVISTENGQDITWPVVDDTSNNASIVGEASSIGTTTEPTFSAVTMKAFKYASPIVKCSVELLADNGVDLESLLADLFAERMGRGQEVDFITGGGTTEPQGLVTGATQAANLDAENDDWYDKIIDLIHSVDIAYRANGAFLMHDSTAAALRKVQDANYHYLWEPSVQVGQPDRLFGYPVYISNSFEEYGGSVGDDKTLILFGDFQRAYCIRDVASSLQVARLDELYAATGEVGFVMLMRTDGRYINADAVKALASYDEP